MATFPMRQDLGQERRRLRFLGSGGAVFGMHLVNMALSILTLGIYSCWGRVKLRQYLYAQLEFMEQRFAYHGRGQDLLVGFFVMGAGVLVMLALLAMSIAGQKNPEDANTLFTLVLYGGIGVLYPFAAVGSRRYLLRHLSWSGVRFSFSGSLGGFLWLYVRGIVLCALTLGVYVPFMQASLHNYMVNNSSYGNLQATSTLRGRELLGPFIRAVFLTPFTLGMVWNYYFATRQRIYMANTRLGDLAFESHMTGSEVFSQRLINPLLLVVTLGLASPWVQIRKLRFILDSTTVIGTPDLAAIRQVQQASGGLDLEVDADFFGFDLGL